MIKNKDQGLQLWSFLYYELNDWIYYIAGTNLD
jgi:hypothetical protein